MSQENEPKNDELIEFLDGILKKHGIEVGKDGFSGVSK
jgi:hypothetical protein